MLRRGTFLLDLRNYVRGRRQSIQKIQARLKTASPNTSWEDLLDNCFKPRSTPGPHFGSYCLIVLFLD